MYVISSLVLVIHPYATHFRSLLPVMHVISSLALVSSIPYPIHLRSLLPVMHVINSLVLMSVTPYTTHLRSLLHSHT
jgi:hypothetical protein